MRLILRKWVKTKIFILNFISFCISQYYKKCRGRINQALWCAEMQFDSSHSDQLCNMRKITLSETEITPPCKALIHLQIISSISTTLTMDGTELTFNKGQLFSWLLSKTTTSCSVWGNHSHEKLFPNVTELQAWALCKCDFLRPLNKQNYK